MAGREFHNQAKTLVDEWCEGVRDNSGCEIVDLMVFSSDQPEEIRSHLIRCHRVSQFDGVQILGAEIPSFVFSQAGGQIATDALYANLGPSRSGEGLWLDEDADGLYSGDPGSEDMPQGYLPDVWVARWAGIDHKKTDENKLFAQFLDRRFTPWNKLDWDAAVVWREILDPVDFGALSNLRSAFPILQEHRTETTSSAILENPGFLSQKRMRHLALFGHGNHTGMEGLDFKGAHSGQRKGHGALWVGLHGCDSGNWRNADQTVRHDSVAMNLLNPASGGPLVVTGLPYPTNLWSEMDVGPCRSLAESISESGYVGLGWLRWSRALLRYFYSRGERGWCYPAGLWPILGDGTVHIWGGRPAINPFHHPLGRGLYEIRPLCSGLPIWPSEEDGGGQVVQVESGTHPGMAWMLEPGDEESYFISHPKTGLVLGGPDGNNEEGARVELLERNGNPFQRWLLVPTTVEAGRFLVVNLGSGLCLDVWGGRWESGYAVHQWGCNRTPAQSWELTAIPPE